ncbi:cysteine--tRNA ligase [Candidatus Omnitrophota bacterium]
MSVHIQNSLTQKKEELVPLCKGKVSIYSCGVTVYDDCHIGHARSLYIFDVLKRYLRYRGFGVYLVRNITDIDDKIIKKANELGVTAAQITKKYTDSYYEDIAALGIEKADVEPKATEHIQEMIQHIQGLIEKEFAYEVDGEVYFGVRKFSDYGKLSNQSLDQMDSGARIEVDGRKVDPLDFALWKKSKEGEPSWDSPWGKGRPGWHIECSVMSMKYLGQTFDIHAGGRDLIFPHHENEIAQSEALTGKTFAKYWIHHGLLTINGQKMAKSVGNFITIKAALKQYDPDVLKLFFLSSHYASPVDFNAEKMEECNKQKRQFDDFFDKVNNWGLLTQKKTPFSKQDKVTIDTLCAKFDSAMDDDCNTPEATACLFELVDKGSQFVSQDKQAGFEYVQSKLGEFFHVFGLRVKPKEKLNAEIEKLIKERDAARKEKNFREADKKREEIEKKFGYCVNDTASNVTLTTIKNEKR